MKFIKCKICNTEMADKCLFAKTKKIIDGKEFHFCSEMHAKEFIEKYYSNK
jgi:YHS domain-containing protein